MKTLYKHQLKNLYNTICRASLCTNCLVNFCTVLLYFVFKLQEICNKMKKPLLLVEPILESHNSLPNCFICNLTRLWAAKRIFLEFVNRICLISLKIPFHVILKNHILSTFKRLRYEQHASVCFKIGGQEHTSSWPHWE